MSIYTHQVLSEAFTLKEGPLSYKVLKTCVFSLFDAVHGFFSKRDVYAAKPGTQPFPLPLKRESSIQALTPGCLWAFSLSDYVNTEMWNSPNQRFCISPDSKQ